MGYGRPVVALESTLIAHGLPWPVNVETALECEAVVRDGGGSSGDDRRDPQGVPTVGMSQRSTVAEPRAGADVFKAGRRDLGPAVALRPHRRDDRQRDDGPGPPRRDPGLRHRRHRRGAPLPRRGTSPPTSPNSRTPVLVVCAGAKSILDIPRTLEILETLGVPVWGYRTEHVPDLLHRRRNRTGKRRLRRRLRKSPRRSRRTSPSAGPGRSWRNRWTTRTPSPPTSSKRP